MNASCISLHGDWSLVLDRAGVGDGPAWFLDQEKGSANLPGSLDAQGIGDTVTVDTPWTATIFDRSFYEAESFARYREQGRVKVPFCLQPETKFVGVAWYRREFTVPDDWQGDEALLTLERPHWATQVWLDDCLVGGGDSLSAPHRYDLGGLERGRSYAVTLRVDNRMIVDVGENAHSVSDHTQGNWNGVVGSIRILPVKALGFDTLEVLSASAAGLLRVRGKLRGDPGAGSAEFAVFESGSDEPLLVRKLEQTELEGCFELELDCGPDVRYWDEFSPFLYRLVASFGGGSREVEFGFRDFTVEGSQFAINGRPVFLRGVLDCCIFPKTGHPPMDVSSWEAVFGRIKECGFNHVRFHSWCPPEAAFVAGDRLGVFLQAECAVWPNAEAVLGFNSPKGIGDGATVDQWAIQEGERILRAYGHHPSFVMLACGNEPGGSRHREYLSAWIEHFRGIDSWRVITGSAGWPALAENEFHVVPDPRIHQWGDGLECRLNGSPPSTVYDYRSIIQGMDRPVVSHEIGQWCAYPSVGTAEKYSGHLKPRNQEIILERLAERDLQRLSEEFQYASGKLQALCYKEEIESSLRTPGLAGFQLLGLQDFPGQGTAPVGLLDAFWEKKSYCEFSEIKRFCDSTVVLARLDKRVFSNRESLVVSIEIAHYGAELLRGESLEWSLLDGDGKLWGQGRMALGTAEFGLNALGLITVDLSEVKSAAKLRLVARLSVAGSYVENDWDLWVYPENEFVDGSRTVEAISSVSDALASLEIGGTVLLANSRVSNEIALGFTPIFWNTACTQGQAPHTLGILCDPQHPALAGFPTDSYTNWQWWYLLRGSAALQLDELSEGLDPIVRVIDDWADNRSLGLLFEAKVGKGRLMVCSVDLFGESVNEEQSLVRGHFASCIQTYMTSDSFAPKTTLTPADLGTLFKD